MTRMYRNEDNTQLSEHFNVQEFRCKCGQNHDILISDELVSRLETLFTALDCSSIVINSGYRCAAHDRAVGGTGTGQHVNGNAADVVCYGQDGQPISSKLVCCKAQDIGFGGIANITVAYTSTHLDVRSGSKWYGNEVISNHTVTDDFYNYFGIIPSVEVGQKQEGDSMRGIDVSRHNGAINWQRVKAAGICLADTDENLQAILDLKNQIQRNNDRKNDLRKLRVKGFLDVAMYNQELRRVEKENDELRNRLKCLDKIGDNGDAQETKKLLHCVESSEMLTEFSDDLFSEFVDSIYVYTRTCIGFRLKCGLTLKEEVCTGTR